MSATRCATCAGPLYLDRGTGRDADRVLCLHCGRGQDVRPDVSAEALRRMGEARTR